MTSLRGDCPQTWPVTAVGEEGRAVGCTGLLLSAVCAQARFGGPVLSAWKGGHHPIGMLLSLVSSGRRKPLPVQCSALMSSERP